MSMFSVKETFVLAGEDVEEVLDFLAEGIEEEEEEWRRW